MPHMVVWAVKDPVTLLTFEKRRSPPLPLPLAPPPPLALGARTVRLDQPQAVGILNLTPDSFSDGGRFGDADAAAGAGFAMAEAGAAIVDVGGESTRPGAKPVWEGDEIERVLP